MARDWGKYEALLDDEIKAYVEKSEASYPADMTSGSPAEQRAGYDAVCAVFDAGYPTGVSASDSSISANGRDIPMRRYEMAGGDNSAEIIYFHGGGFIVGGLDSHDSICAELCAGTGHSLTAIDYALAPEFTWPADHEDAMAAFAHIAGGFDGPLVLAGDSAGANLCAGISHVSRGGAKRPVGQVLIYPGLGPDLTRTSFVEHANAPMITTADTEFYKGIRSGGNPAMFSDPRAMPLIDTDFSGLPPTVIFSAQCDPLCVDGPEYEAEIAAAGGKAICFTENGLVHGYLRARHLSLLAADSFARIIAAISALGKGKWPY